MTKKEMEGAAGLLKVTRYARNNRILTPEQLSTAGVDAEVTAERVWGPKLYKKICAMAFTS